MQQQCNRNATGRRTEQFQCVGSDDANSKPVRIRRIAQRAGQVPVVAAAGRQVQFESHGGGPADSVSAREQARFSRESRFSSNRTAAGRQIQTFDG